MSKTQSDTKGLSFIQRIFRSLHYRNFKLFFMGQGISLIDTWMQMIAAGWLAGLMARLIGAPATVAVNGLWCVVGSILFFNQLPSFRRRIHPVYVKKGIMKDEFAGLTNTL
ncbi:MAG: hypothetical protein PHW60_09095 [Kiritimatiellae bacterium]|nr:hypothetical protein [Kiritimatiellia bacterium]